MKVASLSKLHLLVFGLILGILAAKAVFACVPTFNGMASIPPVNAADELIVVGSSQARLT